MWGFNFLPFVHICTGLSLIKNITLLWFSATLIRHQYSIRHTRIIMLIPVVFDMVARLKPCFVVCVVHSPADYYGIKVPSWASQQWNVAGQDAVWNWTWWHWDVSVRVPPARNPATVVQHVLGTSVVGLSRVSLPYNNMYCNFFTFCLSLLT